MLSTRMMIALCAWYAGIAVAGALERNWPRVLYFIGAILISAAVRWMGKR